ncbi:MAG: hypothetical protein EXR72_14035 [Myxococcales bacterium]|nr:hypothetical protein [Myxococcales bacterium]
MSPQRRLTLLALAVTGCSASSPGPVDLAMKPDLVCQGAGGADGGALHALLAEVALVDDGQGVALFAQNGSMVHVPSKDLAGKPFFFATVRGGESVANAKMIDLGTGVIGPKLTATIATKANYSDGPWELGLFIQVTPGDPMKGPQAGDLASFDLDAPPPCQPPVTGVSVRMTVAGADAKVKLTNRYFIRF